MIVYKITNKINGKIYIGITKGSLDKRWRSHVGSAFKNSGNNHFHNAIRKYGEDNFVVEQIDSAINYDELKEKEKFYIKKFNSIDEGYNSTHGGDSNPMFYYKARKNHKESLSKPEVRKAISDGLKKYIEENGFSEEHRKHLSESALGNHNFGSGDTRSIGCWCIDKMTGKEHHFHSYKDAGIWWFNSYHPFGEKYVQPTLQRKIISMCDGNIVTWGKGKNGKGKDRIIMNNYIEWYREGGDKHE